MSFDVIRFLQDHRIPYRDSGPNCSRGGVVIKCPFCGDDDPSEHMGWDLATGQWNCLRRSGIHSGRKPQRLIMRLTGCSGSVADEIVRGSRELGALDQMLDKFSQQSGGSALSTERGLRFPEEFRPLSRRGIGLHYFNYLVEKRGFTRRRVKFFYEDYGLRFCRTGYWRGRIIFPLWLDGRLVSWTGRTISSRQSLRYMSLPHKQKDSSQPEALESVKNLLWNFDALKEGGKALVLTEGPLDALKVDVYAKSRDVRATCLFGTGVTDGQYSLLWEIKNAFDSVIILGDTGAWMNVMDVSARLSSLRPRHVSLPDGVDDPGDLSPSQVRKIVRGL